MRKQFKIVSIIFLIIFLKAIFVVLITKIIMKSAFNFDNIDLELFLQVILIICFIIIYNLIIKKKIFIYKKDWYYNLVLIGIIFIFYSFFTILLDLFLIKTNVLTKDTFDSYSIKKYLNNVILAPINEELFFRGVLFNLILLNYKSSILKDIVAILSISIIFSFAHMEFNVNFFRHLIFSIVISTIYLKNRNMTQAVLFHMGTNLLIMFSIPVTLNDNFHFIVFSMSLFGLCFLLTKFLNFKMG